MLHQWSWPLPVAVVHSYKTYYKCSVASLMPWSVGSIQSFQFRQMKYVSTSQWPGWMSSVNLVSRVTATNSDSTVQSWLSTNKWALLSSACIASIYSHSFVWYHGTTPFTLYCSSFAQTFTTVTARVFQLLPLSQSRCCSVTNAIGE